MAWVSAPLCVESDSWRSAIPLRDVAFESTPALELRKRDLTAEAPMKVGSSPVLRIKARRATARLDVPVDEPVLHIRSVSQMKQTGLDTIRQPLQGLVHRLNPPQF